MWIDWTGIIIPVLGIIVGCFFTYYMSLVSINHQRKKIALALKNDIQEIDERIRSLASREKIQKGYLIGGDNSAFLLPFIITEDFYYNTIKTEISLFENPLADAINDFYKNIIAAEHYRKMLLEGQGTRISDELYNCLISIEDLTKSLVPLLDTEIEWNVLIPHGNRPRSQIGQTLYSLGKLLVILCIIILVVIGISAFISTEEPNVILSPSTIGHTSSNNGSSDVYYENNPDYVYNGIEYISKPTPTPDVKPELTLSLGQSATNNNGIQTTVFSAQRGKSYSYSHQSYDDSSPQTITVNATKGRDFLILDIETKNTASTEAYEYLSVSAYIRDSDANSYQLSTGLYHGEDSYLHGSRYISGERERGKIAIMIPTTAKDLKLCYNLGGYPSEYKLACWKLEDQKILPF